MCFHHLRTRRTLLYVADVYAWDDDSYDAVQAAGVGWRSVLYVLHHARPRVRSHLGAVLRIAARDQDGRWLGVALIETSDDTYRLVGAHWLDADEQEAVEKMIQGGRP